MEETDRKHSTNKPAADPHGPSPIEKRMSNVLISVGLAILAAALISGVREFLHSSLPPKKAATVAIEKKQSPPANNPQIFIANRAPIVPPQRPADHPLATEAAKPAVNSAVRNLLDKGWALVAPPYSVLRWQQGGEDFERALKVDAGSNESRIGLAYVLGAKLSDQWAPVLQENPKRAEELLREVLNKGDTTPQMAAAHFTLGLVYQAQNRLPEAKTEFMRSISLDPDNARAYLHLGETLMYMGKPECQPFEKAIRLSTQRNDTTAMNYWGLGTCHLILGDMDQGIVGLGKALMANERSWVPYFYLAGAYGLKGDLDEARSALSESLKRKPVLKSLARMRSENPWLGNPYYWALQENTLNRGWRKAGLSDQ